jgi:sulfite exporter TauE/SafE/copper chaperone CopZ
MSFTKTIIRISGMHCRSCEILTEDELLKIPGVTKADVNHGEGIAKISHSGDLDMQAVSAAVKRAGYSIGETKNRGPVNYSRAGLAFLLVAGLFLIIQKTGLLNISGNLSGNLSSLSVVFLIGLTAGVSTCMALVGGLVLAASAKFAQSHPEAPLIQKFIPHLYFNLGRIISFFILGGLIGLLGSVLRLSSSVLGILIIAVGLVMLVMGVQLVNIFPTFRKISLTLPKGISRALKIGDHNPAVTGALTFFLPCGFTQAMQLYAMSTGSAVSGALTMGVFAIGTAPGLLGLGGLASAVKGKFSGLFFKTVGAVVIILAILNIGNGLNLLGINPLNQTPSSAVTGTKTDVNLEDGFQVIRMDQLAGGYSPNVFTIKKGIPVKWIINSRTQYSCATSFVSNQLGIRTQLQPGENIFTFTPANVGKLKFSCGMGMYTGYFQVEE